MGALKSFTSRHTALARRSGDPSKVEWFKRIPLHGAATNQWVETMGFLVDKLGASLNTTNEKGNSCLHQSVIWGHTTCVIWLLERGADYTIVNNEGDTPLQLAQRRQSKFGATSQDSKKELSEEDFQRLVAAGKELIYILSCVTKNGYRHFARHHADHEFVRLHSSWAMREAGRRRMALLRFLTLKSRAQMKSLEELKATLKKEALLLEQSLLDATQVKTHARNSNSGGSEGEKGPTLEDLMMKEGCLDLIHALHAMDVTKPEDLRCVERQMLAKVARLNARERRQLWIFVKAQKATMGEIPEIAAAKKKMQKLSLREQRRMQAEENRRNRAIQEGYDAVGMLFSKKLPDALFRHIVQYIY